MSKKLLQDKYPNAEVKRVLFNDYNFRLILNDKNYHIKVLNVNRNTILSINSKHVWQITKGKAVGITFKASSNLLIDMRTFNKLSNKIIVFKNQPNKILKYINESEVVDISDSKEIFDIKICNSFKEITV